MITALLDDKSYRHLQSALMRRPEQGATIGRTRGARKVRWVRRGAGKRGGIRVIYYWAAREAAFDMLYAYAKNEQGDLTAILGGFSQAAMVASEVAYRSDAPIAADERPRVLTSLSDETPLG